MNPFQALLENAVNGDNVENGERDSRMARIAHWQQTCAAGLLAVTAGCAAWLQLHAGGDVLNSKSPSMSAKDKADFRRSMLNHLFQSERSCYDLIRMSPTTFSLLCEKLQATGRLRTYIHTSPHEQVATFLFIIGQKWTNRAISFFMYRSGETCSRYFHNVLHALMAFAAELVKQTSGNDISPVIMESSRFYPFFKNCLGALDGTHIRVKVPKLEASKYRGRKDFTTQNVLACCSFDLRFTYILDGWEGSASDSRVLKSAFTRKDPLIIPNGKYYLGDADFELSNKILVPFGRTRYHLKEYASRGPQNGQELFNLRHASLRNSIERCFGILKKRFPIISTGGECQYSCQTMTKIILGCCILHNFLIGTEPEEALSENGSSHVEPANDDGHISDNVTNSEDTSLDYTMGKELRYSIAFEM